jgi:hypothetical protein
MFVKLIAVAALLFTTVGLADAAPGKNPCCKRLASCCTKHCCFVR